MHKNFFSTATLALCCCAVSPAGAQTNNPMMKAIVIHEYDGPEALKYEDAPRPEPKDNQVLVKVIAAAVNPVDAMIRSGKYTRVFEQRCRSFQDTTSRGSSRKAREGDAI